MTFKILAINYSQTGQLDRTVASFLEPFSGERFHVTHVSLEPVKPFPFPWSFLPFFEAMPDTVSGHPRTIMPLNIDLSSHFDLVVIGYQPWFLTLSQPIQAFLKQYGSTLLRDRPVVAITACRDMWHEAFLQLRDAVQGFGGRICEHVVVTDPTPKLVSLFTTPIWLAFGRKKFLPMFPEAGIRTPEYTFVRNQGTRYATFISNRNALPTPGFLKDPTRLDTNKIFTEKIVRYLFRFSAAFARAVGAPDTWQRRVAITIFLCYFLASLPSLLVFGHVAFLFASGFFRKKLGRYEDDFCCQS